MPDVSSKMRSDVSLAFAYAMDGDPATRVNRTSDFIILLLNAMKILGDTTYDAILKVNLERSYVAVKYWYDGGNENQGHAVVICKGIMADLLFLAYDIRVSDPKSATFQRVEIKGTV